VHGLRDRARYGIQARLDRESTGLASVRSRPVLAAPYRMVDERAAELGALLERSRRTLDHRLARAASELEHTLARVVALSPAATLQRGYAVLQREGGAVVRDPAQVASGERLRARVAEGEFAVTVDQG
jgi:exodeoxyribonuclease VII large subunit